MPTQRTPPRKFKSLSITTPSPIKLSKPAQPSRNVLDAIIAQANEAARQLRLQQEAEVKANAEEEAKKRERRETRKQRSEEKRARRRKEKERARGKEWAKGGSENEKDRERKHKSPSSTKNERDAKREKQLLKLVGAVVVGYLSQYRQHLDDEQFKKHAKEVYSFHLLIPCIIHNDLIAHAYNRGTREKRCYLPFRRQTRGAVRRETHKNQEIR
jgi:flagellar biosynthesis GTPase FlhF